jgi:hypothetical protein
MIIPHWRYERRTETRVDCGSLYVPDGQTALVVVHATKVSNAIHTRHRLEVLAPAVNRLRDLGAHVFWVRALPEADELAIKPDKSDTIVFDGFMTPDVFRQYKCLLFAGYSTNVCVPWSPVGMKACRKRGYLCVLLEDLTLSGYPGSDTELLLEWTANWLGIHFPISNSTRLGR